MLSHAKPEHDFEFNLSKELENLDTHRINRVIPVKTNDNLLIASWNLTNFGVQKRQVKHLKIMARIISFFDLVAVQEIADDITHLNKILKYLGKNWDVLYTDPAGNNERLGYIYDKDKVVILGLAAELAMRGYERRRITIEVEDESGVEEYEGFNRNPFIVNFGSKQGNFVFNLVNVHLYWSNLYIRQLETVALASWAKKRVGKKFPPNNDIILLGDFNMPTMRADDPIFEIVDKKGLYLPKDETNVTGTNLAGDKHYDQIAFFPSKTTAEFSKKMGVFDFDNALFPDFWNANDTTASQRAEFFKYIRYYIADHRVLWAQFKTQ